MFVRHDGADALAAALVMPRRAAAGAQCRLGPVVGEEHHTHRVEGAVVVGVVRGEAGRLGLAGAGGPPGYLPILGIGVDGGGGGRGGSWGARHRGVVVLDRYGGQLLDRRVEGRLWGEVKRKGGNLFMRMWKRANGRDEMVDGR